MDTTALVTIDDTFTAVHKDKIDHFHEHLGWQNADMQFTKETEMSRTTYKEQFTRSMLLLRLPDTLYKYMHWH